MSLLWYLFSNQMLKLDPLINLVMRIRSGLVGRVIGDASERKKYLELY